MQSFLVFTTFGDAVFGLFSAMISALAQFFSALDCSAVPGQIFCSYLPCSYCMLICFG